MSYLKPKAQQSWSKTEIEGVSICHLRSNETNGGASLVRLRQGAHFPLHNHLGWEEVLILSGRIVVSGQTLSTGDYFYTEAGEVHDTVAEEDTIAFVSLEKDIEIFEE